MTINQRVKRLRHANHQTVEEVSSLSGVNVEFLRAIEAGAIPETAISFAVVIRLARGLNCSQDYLVHGGGDFKLPPYDIQANLRRIRQTLREARHLVLTRPEYVQSVLDEVDMDLFVAIGRPKESPSGSK